jgi:hypothetical protein
VISTVLGMAWDVTTVKEVWDHVQRDVFGKRGVGSVLLTSNLPFSIMSVY